MQFAKQIHLNYLVVNLFIIQFLFLFQCVINVTIEFVCSYDFCKQNETIHIKKIKQNKNGRKTIITRKKRNYP